MDNLDESLFETRPEPKDDAAIRVVIKPDIPYWFRPEDWEEGRTLNNVIEYDNGVVAFHLKMRTLIYPLTEVRLIEVRNSSDEHMAEWNEWFKETHGGLSHEEFHIMRRRGAIDDKVDLMVSVGVMDQQTASIVKGAVYEIIGDYLDSSHSH